MVKDVIVGDLIYFGNHSIESQVFPRRGVISRWSSTACLVDRRHFRIVVGGSKVDSNASGELVNTVRNDFMRDVQFKCQPKMEIL